MPINQTRIRGCLTDFNFKKLFVEELGWDRHDGTLEVPIDGQSYVLRAIAQKRGVQIFECPPTDRGIIPDYATRKKIDRQVTKSAFEHLVIFTDSGKTLQIWQWVARESGKATAYREYPIRKGQSGDIIVQKLQAITFPLDEEEALTVTGVVFRLKDAFDKDRVTKKFYDLFKKEHDGFLKFIEGIPDENLERWYASVMINRLMFIYFIQKKGFLNSDVNYLNNKLQESKRRGKDRFYKDFLCPLFFEGFARKEQERSQKMNQLLGKIPYLNGGLFLKHQIEKLHGKQIDIPDKAFDKLFAFFDEYEWHLDARPIAKGNEINPDVLGYIFEKYINQKELGAYYTKEDITGYISKNTIIPYLFDVAKKECKIAFEGEHSVWKMLQADPDRYIYDALKKGVGLSVPLQIAQGVHSSKRNLLERRKEWNKPAPPEYALPTEIWREVVARRQRHDEVRTKLANGEIHDINDLITYNLSIVQFAQDVIENCEGPDLLNAFWKAINKVTVLDPTCGSGAFLFAALNILESLYEACLQRMEAFIIEWGEEGKKRHPNYQKFFSETLKRVEKHPNTKYFIYKSIIINNLFGVDILEEGAEICKLRLFLKLASQVELGRKIEALPDIDFNIRAGNTLVGYATYNEVQKAVTSKLDFDNAMKRIEEKAEDVDRLFALFRQQQTEIGGEVTPEDKEELRKRLKTLEDELNRYLANEYGVDPKNNAAFEKWLSSHKPFHWFIEFYGIIKQGGFSVVIGNPPFVEYNKVRSEYSVMNYSTMTCGNLYAFVAERSLTLLNDSGCFGLIFPISLICTQRMERLQDLLLTHSSQVCFSNYAERPSKLFVGAEVLLTIAISRIGRDSEAKTYSTKFTKWTSEERETLFDRTMYLPFFGKIKPYVVPKQTSDLENDILRKLMAKKERLGLHFLNSSKYPIYYRIGGGRYWKVFTNFQPKFILNGKKAVSSRENYLFFKDLAYRDAAISALSSSLFFWYFIITTNCRDLNPVDLEEFPFSLNSATDEVKKKLVSLCAHLMDEYEERSKFKEKTSRLTGEIVYQEFYPRESKALIDQIDRVLAQHYGFTDEELDFIINYDIKYRMGRDAGEDE